MNTIPREIIQKILEAGVQAPSGSNSQPWKFRVRGNEIFVYALPERDHPILNFRWRGTWIAHGALIENMAVAAAALGYSLDIHAFPDLSDLKLTARIVAYSGAAPTEKDKALYEAVFRRSTNRKPYKSTPLTAEQKEEIVFAAREVGAASGGEPRPEAGRGDFRFTEDREKIKKLAVAVAVNEVVMFENEELQNLFFNELVWEGEEGKKEFGLLLKTLELKPPQKVALKVFKTKVGRKFLTKLGMAKQIARDNAKIYASVSMLGAIIAGDNDADFILAGQVMERAWLTASRLGLSAQFIAGLTFLQFSFAGKKAEGFSEKHVDAVSQAYTEAASLFDVHGDKIVAGFLRIGHGGEPSARSPKKPPEVEWET